MKNALYYGDNLDVLRRKVGKESVDLCYIDPPFNSKRNYFQIYNNQGSEDRAQAQAFVDTWNWGDEAAEGLGYILDIERLNPRAGDTLWTEQTVELIRGLEKVLGRGSLLAYLVHMTLRIVEIHRVLKSTGSFYLHCDPTASHYLKLVLDAVFCGQGGDYLNEIVWSYRRWPTKARRFQKMHDVIFYYCKTTDQHIFNTLLDSPTASSLKRWKGKKQKVTFDETGKRNPTLEEGPESIGVAMNAVWPISIVAPSGHERLGYDTQKPEALLERIIRASSNEGDTVLDAYCGCGTTVAVAQRLNRRWIGIDITYQSIALILKRLQDRYPDTWPEIEANIHLDGVPRDFASAMALANRKDDKTRKEFEKWAILTYSRNQARINEKKGADGGIDGIAYFLIDKDTNGKAIFQVKSRDGTRADLATLNSDRQRAKAEFGFLICTGPVRLTKAMREEIEAAGKYRHPLLDREDDRLQVVLVSELFEYTGRPASRLNLPMARADAVKAAVALGVEDKQAALDL